MTFKPAIWGPIAVALSALNLVAVGFAAGAAEPWHAAVHATLGLGFGLWAQRLRQRPREGEVTGANERMEQQLNALEDVQAALASQATQLNELQERVDFTERLLAQLRDRPVLNPRDKQG